MATQLRLVEAAALEAKRPPQTRSRPAQKPSPSKASSKQARASVGTRSRRAVRWGDWELDARTRRIGRAGVAAAREALEHAPTREPLRRAS